MQPWEYLLLHYLEVINVGKDSKMTTFNDSMSININFKWLLQIVVLTAVAVYGFWTIESRIQALERNMSIALEEIELHEQERLNSQQAHVDEMEERMKWYEKELSINPFSWGKRK